MWEVSLWYIIDEPTVGFACNEIKTKQMSLVGQLLLIKFNKNYWKLLKIESRREVWIKQMSCNHFIWCSNYSGDLNTEYPSIGNIKVPDFKKSIIQVMSELRTIQTPDNYWPFKYPANLRSDSHCILQQDS